MRIRSTFIVTIAAVATLGTAAHVAAEGGQCTSEWDNTIGQPGMNPFSIFALAVFDDGNGPALYAGGDFTTAGGLSANRIAAWRGCGASQPACPADLNASGEVNVDDLLMILNNWGPCA